MQQNYRGRTIPRPLIAHMHLHARCLDKLRWRLRPARLERLNAAVWRPGGNHARNREDDDGDNGDEQQFEDETQGERHGGVFDLLLF